MERQALKDEIKKLLDQVHDEALLKQFHQWLHIITQPKLDNWWDNLTDEQHEELIRAEEEIKDPNNLIDHKDAMENARRFLRKDNNGDWWNQLEKP